MGSCAASSRPVIIPATNGTAIVGTYAPNDWGLYDMAGNVYEWCLDWYEDDIAAHGGKVNIDPARPDYTLSGTQGASRSYRGGCWYFTAGSCRSAWRGKSDPAQRMPQNGVRLLCTAGLQ